jgi:hypothetical protein
MSMSLLVGGVTIVVAGLFFSIFGRRADLRRAKRLSHRPELSLQEFQEQFYRDSDISPGLLAEALRVLEEATAVPRGQLRPQDRFAEELAPEKGWEFDDGLAELRWELEARGKDRDSVVSTVDDFIRVFAETKP